MQIPEPTKMEATPANPDDAPLTEKDLYGLYLQAGTGSLIEFKPDGKLGGWPVGGTYKFVGKNRIDLLQVLAGKEERLPVNVLKQPEGLMLTRNVHGELETIPLHRLSQVELDAKAWAGPCMMHVLVSGDKIATKREVVLKEDGYLRNKDEKGYWLRFMKDGTGKQTIGFTSNLEDQTLTLYLYKIGPLLIAFDSLEKPKLVTIIQLGEKAAE